MLYRTVLFLLLVVELTYAQKASPRIVIIGAGASGIAAASKLLENNFENVLILEAEGRIGGRIYTREFDGYLVDLGAQWVHGEKNNVAYELAAPLGLIEHSTMESGKYDMYEAPGKMLDRSIAHNLEEFFMQTYDGAPNATGVQYGSEGAYFEDKLNGYFAEHPEISEKLQKQILFHYDALYTTADPAVNWHEVAFEDFATYVPNEGDKLINWKERGYSTILDVLMKKIPNPEEELPVLNNTHLNSEVVRIDYTGVDGTVKIRTHDGKEHVADHVIVTTSLGVLKAQYETLFEPALPATKVDHIKGLSFGTVCKIYLAFNESWWNDREKESAGFAFLWNEDIKKEYENDPNKKWALNQALHAFVQYRPRLLLIWVSGEGARLIEDIPDDLVLSQTMEVLRRFLGSDYNITEPTAMIRSRWYKSKHFLGTYSYRSTHTASVNASAQGLSEPITKSGKPVILFGGEATSKHQYSTVQGAISSGWREADRLIRFYNESNSAAEAAPESE